MKNSISKKLRKMKNSISKKVKKNEKFYVIKRL